MNAVQHLIWARSSLEDYADKWSDQDLIRDINAGARLCQKSTKHVEVRSTLSTVANQRDYDLPPDVDIPKRNGVLWLEGTVQRELAFREFDRFTPNLPQLGPSYEYTLAENQRRLYLYTTPSASAATTTLTSAIAVGDTTVSGTDFSSFPAGPARVVVDSGVNKEVIEYRSINAAGTQLQGIERALEGTNRVAHANSLTVTLRDLTIYGSLWMPTMGMRRLYNTGRALFTRDDETVTGSGTPGPAWTTEVWARDEIGPTVELYKIDPGEWMTVQHVVSNTSLELSSRWLKTTTPALPYWACQPNPLGDHFDEVIHDYVLMCSAEKDGDAKMISKMEDKIASELGIAKEAVRGEARPMTVQGYHDTHPEGEVTRGMRVNWT